MVPQRSVLAALLVLGASLHAKEIAPAPDYYKSESGLSPRPGRWDTLLPPLWEGWKTRFVIGGEVSGPGFESRSRLQVEGMLLSLWFGDQATFDSLWKYAEIRQWDANRRLYKEFRSGSYVYTAEFNLEMAGALLSAKALAEAGLWNLPTERIRAYQERTHQILTTAYRDLIPQGSPFQILPYPNAASRKMSDQTAEWFESFQLASLVGSLPRMDKEALERGVWELLDAQPYSSAGMIRNASTPSGASVEDCFNCFPNARVMGSEGLRAVWHLARTIQTNPNLRPQLVSWARKAWKSGRIDPRTPGMYQVESATLWGWENNSYAHFATRALWGSLAAAAQDSSDTSEAAHKAFHIIQDSLQNAMVPGVDFLTDGDTSLSAPVRNDLEAQTMGLLGILAMTNNTPDVYQDLRTVCCGPSAASRQPVLPTAVARRTRTGAEIRLDKSDRERFARAKVVGLDGSIALVPASQAVTTAEGLRIPLGLGSTSAWVLLEDASGKVFARSSVPPSF